MKKIKVRKTYVRNSNAKFIHRIKQVTEHTPKCRDLHLALKLECGNQFAGPHERFTFIWEPANGELICARCEAMAVAKGHKTSREIVGKKVALGRLYASQVTPDTDRRR